MYIQNHHIQNVLNEYRKRLSQPTGSNAKKVSIKSMVKDTVQLSESNQRQSIMDQVSTDIIERISRTGSKNGKIANNLSDPAENGKGEKKSQQEMDFVYTTIDENDQKSTRIIPITHLKPSMASFATSGETRFEQGKSASNQR